jgi:hypothetical protein
MHYNIECNNIKMEGGSRWVDEKPNRAVKEENINTISVRATGIMESAPTWWGRELDKIGVQPHQV